MPRGAILGLDRAFNGSDPEWTKQWLGDDPDYWKYVYFTEADLIVHTRPSALQSLKLILDENLILTPHRVLVVPHQDDAPELSKANPRLVERSFKEPQLYGDEVEPRSYCCNEQRWEHRPGRYYPRCGQQIWFRCGSKTTMPPPPYNATHNHTSRHGRFDPYNFIRLSHGTRVTAIAGSAHGKRCIVSSSPCQFHSNQTIPTAKLDEETPPMY